MSNRFVRKENRAAGAARVRHPELLGASWLPSDLSSLLAWIRSDFVEASGADVTQMTDLSGNGHHMAAAATYEPQLTESNPLLNGHPTVDFSPAQTSRMIPITNTKSDWRSLHDGTGSTIVLVLVPRGATTGWIYGSAPINNTPGATLRWKDSEEFWDVTLTDGTFITNDGGGPGTAEADVAYVVQRSYKEGRSSEFELGTSGSSLVGFDSLAAPFAGDSNQVFRLGSKTNDTEYGEFDLAEMFVTSAIFTAGERAAASAYLNARYNVSPVWD